MTAADESETGEARSAGIARLPLFPSGGSGLLQVANLLGPFKAPPQTARGQQRAGAAVVRFSPPTTRTISFPEAPDNDAHADRRENCGLIDAK